MRFLEIARIVISIDILMGTVPFLQKFELQ